ncbi:MAG: WD40/YVTN/BNR-like repeat-containing protein, partial [Planctomycetota bacterium]
DPSNSDVLYISTGIFDREAANSDHTINKPGGEGILKSIDGGQTWQSVNNGLSNLYVGTLFMHPTNPDILLAGTGNNAYPDGGGVYLTTNGGTLWQEVLANENINAVEFAFSNPNIAYAGSAGAVYRSEDGGQIWQKVSLGQEGWGSPGVRAGFPIDFQVDPNDPNRVFANNYGGGNFLSVDGGQTWTVASDGYTGAQVRDITIDPTNPAVIYAAARSGIFTSTNGGDSWVGLNTPPAFHLEWNTVAIDPLNPKHVLASNNWDPIILQSDNRGQTWRFAGDRLQEGMAWRVLKFSPSNSRTVYAGSSAFFSAGVFDDRMSAAGVYVSYDGGTTWNVANDTLSAQANVIDLAVDPCDPQVVFAATGTSGLLKSSNGGNSWIAMQVGVPTSALVLSVAIDPSNPDVVFAGYANRGLYRSDDSGTTWRPSMDGMAPEARVSDIIFDPKNPQVLYAAESFSGVYQSTDSGRMWRQINSSLRTRAVNRLAISADGLYLYAATEGGGVYRLDISGELPQIVPVQ